MSHPPVNQFESFLYIKEVSEKYSIKDINTGKFYSVIRRLIKRSDFSPSEIAFCSCPSSKNNREKDPAFECEHIIHIRREYKEF